MGFLLTPLITCIPTGRTDTICVPKHQKTKEIDTGQIDMSKLQCCSIFRKSIQNQFSVTQYGLCFVSLYTLTNEVQVIEGKVIQQQQQQQQ